MPSWLVVVVVAVARCRLGVGDCAVRMDPSGR